MIDRVVFRDVCVDFPIYDASARSLRHRFLLNKVSSLVIKAKPSIGGAITNNSQGVVVVRALDHVNFSLSEGDRLAILGHNGSGKSTLLRVAAGIYEPHQGEVITQGRVMPLFNMMEGMSPDATGWEMVRTRGILLGLSEAEIAEKATEIANFCDLGVYMQMPVRMYSTGMLIRLAFAITTAVTSEILIMDEFIGAGDAAFFSKAQERLRRFVASAGVLLLATHSPDTVRHWCNKALLLQRGEMVEFGDVESVLSAYAKSSA